MVYLSMKPNHYFGIFIKICNLINTKKKKKKKKNNVVGEFEVLSTDGWFEGQGLPLQIISDQEIGLRYIPPNPKRVARRHRRQHQATHTTRHPHKHILLPQPHVSAAGEMSGDGRNIHVVAI